MPRNAVTANTPKTGTPQRLRASSTTSTASGSSSSAAAAVAHKKGAVDNALTVHMPGGQIQIKIGPDYAVTMTGPATRVGLYTMDGEVIRQDVKL